MGRDGSCLKTMTLIDDTKLNFELRCHLETSLRGEETVVFT
jgi:hypothetical protein